ncbi:MAG: LysR substrate-binding domain-containing protein [Burkholderiaceae bacterium]
MKIAQLELLVVLADTGSLRRAASRMNLSQPALTRSLRQLEAAFATTLVQRSPRGVRLTPAGERLAARARAIGHELRRAREEIDALGGEAGGLVSIGASSAVMMQIVPAAVALFRSRRPAVRLRLVETLYPEAFTRLRAGEFDFVVGPVPPEGAGSDLVARRLFQNSLHVVARCGHPHVGTATLAELADADWALVGPSGGPGDLRRLPFEVAVGADPDDATVDDGRRDRGPVPAIVCESLPTFLELAPEMNLLGLVPGHLLERARAAGLVPLALDVPVPPVTIHLVRAADRALTPAAALLADCLEEAARHVDAGADARPSATIVASKPSHPARQSNRSERSPK